MRVALDSNVLIYSAGIVKVPKDQEKKQIARSLIDVIDDTAAVVCPLQTFGEAYSVMLRAGWQRAKCGEKLREWGDRFETAASGQGAYMAAIELATDHKLQFWDALIVAVSAGANCQMLLSEDMQAGFTWRGITVVNPFAPELDRRLARLLTD